MEDEIQMMRVANRRLLGTTRESKDIEGLLNVLNTLGLATTGVGGLIKTRKFWVVMRIIF